MSETDKPQPDPEPGPQQSGAEAPTQPAQPAPQPSQEQTVQAPPAHPAPYYAPPAPRRPPHITHVRTWLAAAIGAGILIIAGLGGFFIGAASNDHEGGRPGMSRYDNRGPGGPGFHGRIPDPGNFPSRGATPG